MVDALTELIIRHLEGELDADQRVELNRRLADDAEARELFVMMCLQARLFATRTQLPAANPSLDAESKPTPTLPALSHVEGSGVEGRLRRSVWYKFRDQGSETRDQNKTSPMASPRSVGVALAAIITLAITAWFVLFTDPRSPNPETAVDSPSVAIMTDTRDAAWGDSVMPTALGSELPPGRLILKSGSAQVMFKSGAVVDLSGTCDFEMIGRNIGRLAAGSISVYVPAEANGFTIHGPDGLKVIDLGTRFDMRIAPASAAHVRVVEGQVRVDFPEAGDARRSITLAARQHLTLRGSAVDRQLLLIDQPFDRIDSLEDSDWIVQSVDGAELTERGEGRVAVVQAKSWGKLRHRMADVALDEGQTLTLGFDLHLPAVDGQSQQADSAGFRFGVMHNPEPTPRYDQTQSRGYRFNTAVGKAGVNLDYESPGQAILGGASMPGDRKLTHERVALWTADQWHRVQLKLTRRAAATRLQLIVDGQTRIDHLDDDITAMSRFNAIGFATGQAPTIYHLDNVTVTLADDAVSAEPVRPTTLGDATDE